MERVRSNMLKVFEAFAGIGTQRMALRNLGIPHEVVAISEIDKFAIKSYEAIHGKVNNLGDISRVNPADIPDHDLFTYSFPCQDISIAGKQAGLDIDSGTRSSLLWECQKVIHTKKPKYLLMENVKALVNKTHKPNFDKFLGWLEQEGYTNYWKVLNAKDYNIPQQRERVFCVSILGEHAPYIFPSKITQSISLKDFLENGVDKKHYLTTDRANKLLQKIITENKVLDKEVVDSTILKPKVKKVMNTITARYNAGVQNKQSIGGAVVERVSKGANESQGYIIRRLTPKECWRLMGISDEDFEKAQMVNSDSQLYKQAGNAIVVDVLEAIFRRLYEKSEKEKG